MIDMVAGILNSACGRLCLTMAMAVATVSLGACQKEVEPAANRLPTATEIFNLRSKCAELGEKVKNANVIGTALTKEQVSRYSSQSNRCYVRLDVHTADLTTPQNQFIRDEYLYDGQTQEMLAFVSWKGSVKSGDILSKPLKIYARLPALPTYEEVDALIDRFMAEDLKP